MVAAAGPAKARSVNGLGWQTAIRGLFDPQRIFGAVANRGGGADGSAAPAGSQLRPLIDHPMTPAVLATSTSRPQDEGLAFERAPDFPQHIDHARRDRARGLAVFLLPGVRTVPGRLEAPPAPLWKRNSLPLGWRRGALQPSSEAQPFSSAVIAGLH